MRVAGRGYRDGVRNLEVMVKEEEDDQEHVGRIT